MPKVKPLKAKSRNMTKHEFYTAYHYALQYNDFKNIVDTEASLTGTDPEQAGMPRGNGTSDPTYTKAVKISQYRDKMREIEHCALMAGDDIYKWLLKGVTQEECTYTYLQTQLRIPCCKNVYYERRRKFYYLLAQHLKTK